MAAPAVADLSLADLLARVQAIPKRANGAPNQTIGNALLGGVAEPGLTIREALGEFWKISVDQVRGKTPDQERRWKTPRIKAIENLVKVIGNKQLADLTRADAKAFRDWWNGRIDAEGLTANSANKDFVHVAHTFNVVNESLGLGLSLSFGKLTIKAMEKGQRRPFSDRWIRETLLKPGVLDGLNQQPRTITLMCINTGARPSEIAELMKHHFHLTGEVPYIEIVPEGRQLKNAPSARRIPLVGVSLDAAKAYMPSAPDGDKAFP